VEENPAPRSPRRFGLTAAALAVFVAAMVGMSFAAVPLYREFCQITGYNGTVRRAEVAPKVTVDRWVTVRFDANVGNGLGWSFRPEQRSVRVKLGEVATVKFAAENRLDQTVTGSAVFNVSPDDVGGYFNKIACFCFTQQTLKAGEQEELPVTFFVDPSMVNDSELATTDTITLSYTFYPATPDGTAPQGAALATPSPARRAVAVVAAPASGTKLQ
jgi:cytochrome c oxidase assembly protein subunit 11